MSDSNDEEGLISQDDIDKLLESSTIEEAEEKIFNSTSKEEEDGDDGVDDFGELSQDDIDNLMNANAADVNDVPDEEENPAGDDMELISQDDIDQLMNSNVTNDTSVEEDPLPSGDENGGTDDFGELSQDDIDSLLNADSEDVSASDLEDADEDFEMISQDDINSLMGGTKTSVEAVDTEADDALLVEASGPADETGDDAVTDVIAAEAEDSEPEDDYMISDSEAMDVQDCLITQETMNDLVNNFDSGAPAAAAIVLDEPDIADDPVMDAADLTDDLLDQDMDITDLDFDDENSEDVSQDDINALLLAADDEDGLDEDEDDILISQDDINTLLMAADQEDEDVLGDLMDSEFNDDLDEDLFDSDETDEMDDPIDFEEASDEDQVVLEELEEDEDEQLFQDPDESSKKRSPGKKPSWITSKLVIAGISALIVMGITVPVSYFFFSSGEKPDERQIPVALESSEVIEVETVDVEVPPPETMKNSGNITLTDFVIMASDLSDEIAYIIADISIDYSDERAYHEIQDNVSFYRDVIYQAITKSLDSEKRDEVTEADLLWTVETSLKKVLPGNFIDRVSFKSFKAG